MEPLSDGALVVVVQNLQLALDYQHQQVDQRRFGPNEVEDVEDYLVQAGLILGMFEAEYERRVARGTKLTPLSALPRIKLSPPAP